ncbi:aldehyde dehydrogenase family protein [Falsigemmobacter faecalis]|uniref:Aldehyde dehydrogenase n=1 Tax=Falsigemmobacter faecalis TaxID=2488730 RepID=A0A3P3DDW7_9RHOB|nr:aldehyde dehydrogenase family protein [Falsigemmobacter faecalis]RRH72481.1 aldehyde dehydrogenase family protein [Falsigemmobacter faecalis]
MSQSALTIFDAQRRLVPERRLSFDAPARAQALEALRRAVLDHEGQIIAALAEDFGKPEAEVLLTEILPVLSEIRLAQRKVKSWARDRRVGPTLTSFGTSARIRREPRGVCLIIAPWNYPLNLALGPLVSCLAAGNSAVVKPSELTPATSGVIAKIIAAAFDPDLVAVIEGGVETSTELLALPFDHIFFTGSPEVGRIVMTAAAKHLSTVTLELGGKSPVIVGPGADLAQAADWITFGKLTNSGQTCIAPDHLFVHEAVREAFLPLLRARMARALEGAPMARIVSPRHAARLESLLQEAEEGGAKVLRQGSSAGTQMAPALVSALTPQMRLEQEEIFGPILPVIPFRDPAAVLARINARPKPLALYVFEKDRDFIDQVITSTSSGGVGVNLTVLHYSHEGLPFGGVNHSGHGAAHGEWGFLAFSHQRAILQNRFSPLRMIFPPWTGQRLRLIRWAKRLIGGGAATKS